MKILHICMTQYSNGWSYQENMLAKYHKLAGNDVYVLTSMFCYKEGKLVEDTVNDFIDENGVRVLRLKKKKEGLFGKLPVYNNFEKTIDKISPDIIFSHGCQYRDIKYVKKYVQKNKNCKLFVDNHADFSNSGTNLISKYLLHRIIWRHYSQLIKPYVSKFYGVLPSRVDFLISEYKIPKENVELLEMGLDDELAIQVENSLNKELEKEKLGISEDDFVIITGGKIDSAKRETLDLMRIINNLNFNIKLLIFGSIDDELKDEFNALLSKKNIYLGWLNQEATIKYSLISDIAIFPGRHSVIWEQMCGLGIPMIVRDWAGTHHVDKGENVIFIKDKNEINDIIIDLMESNLYIKMKENANSFKKVFYYSEISKRSIEWQ